MKQEFSFQKGFAASYLTVLILGALLTIGGAAGFFVFHQQRILRNTVASAQAYYGAEGGIEDALVKLAKGMEWSSSYTLPVGNASTAVQISDLFAGSRTITAKGDVASRVRKVRAVYTLDTTEAEFFYGAQVGDGGLVMKNNSTVNGNVFSNGSVRGEPNSQLNGTVKVAGTGDYILGANVSQDAYVDRCDNSVIGGVLHALSQTACTYASFVSESPPDPIPLPIPQSDIDNWKEQAAAGGAVGSQTYSSGTWELGPVKILGDLTVQNTATLVIKGTIWVTGNVTVGNSARVQLASSYGSLSGQIISDGRITLQNNSVSSGSGTAGSYLMYLSTSSANPALMIQNFAQADILYTSQGWINVANNSSMRQITGYGIQLENSAQVTYEIGLQDAAFTSGPSAGWKVTNWQEIE